MPELPEVETVARALREGVGMPALVGHTIQSAQVLWHREIGNMKPRAFEAAVAGAQVQSIARHGKYLILTLTQDAKRKAKVSVLHPASLSPLFMLIHLKMSGRLDVVSRDQAFTKHARVVWLLDDDLALRFDDARKFGRVWLTDDATTVIGQLGPDALDVTEDGFVARLKARRGAIKPLLLNQNFLAGVGNIYADESLYRSKLHPKRTIETLTESDMRRLYKNIRAVLMEGIAANGASFDWVYPNGNFQNNFKVYGMTDAPCPICGEPIRRILVGQRSTHFCPSCQPL
jgi:formamidopyrimidine-DNA glycosylase